MSVGAFTIYGSTIEGLGDGAIDLDSHAMKCGFVSAGYTPADSHSLWSQVSGSEISASGYTAGGVSLAGMDYTADGSTTVSFKVSNFTVSGTGTKKVKYGIIYDISSTPANRLIGYWDMEATSTTGVEATQITVSFPSTVVFKAKRG